MSVTVTRRVWFLERIKQSVWGIFMWFLLVIGSLILLWWNEVNFVETKQSLSEVGWLVQEVSSDEVDPANEDSVIHIVGDVKTDDLLRDDDFAIALPAGTLKLQRRVEMYQWTESSKTETKDNLGGSQTETTTYTYKKEWSSDIVDSSTFQEKQRPANPGYMPFQEEVSLVMGATVGAFELNQNQIAMVPGKEKLVLQNDMLENIDPELAQRTIIANNYIIIGQTEKPTSTPKIGDVRISRSYVPATTVSIIGQQKNNTLQAYQTDAGKAIFVLEGGQQSAQQMIESAQSDNVVMTWLLRGFGMLLCMAGFSMIFSILPTIASVVPFLGWIVWTWIKLVSAVLWFSLSFLIIALAWLRFRPIVAVVMIVIAVWAWVGLYFYRKKDATAVTAA